MSSLLSLDQLPPGVRTTGRGGQALIPDVDALDLRFNPRSGAETAAHQRWLAEHASDATAFMQSLIAGTERIRSRHRLLTWLLSRKLGEVKAPWFYPRAKKAAFDGLAPWWVPRKRRVSYGNLNRFRGLCSSDSPVDFTAIGTANDCRAFLRRTPLCPILRAQFELRVGLSQPESPPDLATAVANPKRWTEYAFVQVLVEAAQDGRLARLCSSGDADEAALINAGFLCIRGGELQAQVLPRPTSRRISSQPGSDTIEFRRITEGIKSQVGAAQ